MQVAHVSCLAVNTRLDLKIEDEDEDKNYDKKIAKNKKQISAL